MDEKRTLDQLEGTPATPPTGSIQADRAAALRRVPLAELSIEDLRVLITTEQGLPHVVPRALEILAANPDAAGGRFPGDLLAAVERLPSGFWLTHVDLRHKVEHIQSGRRPHHFDD